MRNFDFTTSEWRIQVFRVLFGLGCLDKFFETFRHEGWKRFAPGTFNRYYLERKQGVVGRWVAETYQLSSVVRVLPAFVIVLGFWTRVCIVIVIASFVLELLYDPPRKTPVFFILNGIYLMLAGDSGMLFHFSAAQTTANTWAQCLIALTTIHLYWNSAWIKLRSPQFRSGRALAQVVHVAERTKDMVKFREYCLPAWAWRPFAGASEVDVARWRVAAIVTIAMEITVPIGLLFRPTYLVFVVLGVGMHVIFTFLKPRGLVPFSLLTSASYLAFLP
ncbi:MULTISPECIES: hypothetical protein [Amycolatopsis]|uniref:hypothetical protein n=1 Tax=Amycolatopsis TaxID=1813 RepID=UPI000B8B489A|nr:MULTISPECIES: hypothetical protein [Amycolatopsis]OXM72800.1 hypothetical protein CF166_13310 [Amycolatopsis sp. KNN50.9b]